MYPKRGKNLFFWSFLLRLKSYTRSSTMLDLEKKARRGLGSKASYSPIQRIWIILL